MIVLEFNELCTELIDEFMGRGLLPNFRRLHERSTVFTTEAGEVPPNLQPWIQWPSVHSGMTFAEHAVLNLGDGIQLREKSVAELLSDAGIPVGVFGSMNVNYRKLNGYFLPDPWHKEGKATPELLQPYFRVIARQVQESSREDAFGFPEMASLGWFLVRNGLTFGTASEIAHQLVDERRDPGLKWRRASVLDQLQYDVFRRLNARFGVRFATFFSNSTAHYQHYYWRNMRPELFKTGVSADDHASWRDAILFGYQSMDRLIARALADYPDAIVVLCTALSQSPWTDTTKCTYRPRDFRRLFDFAGIASDSMTVQPIMAEQFQLEFSDGAASRQAEEALRKLMLGDRRLMYISRESETSLLCGCGVHDAQLTATRVTRQGDGAEVVFADLFYMIHTMRSGHHNPRGSFWVGNGKAQIVAEPVPITDIAPTVLEHFGVAKPAHMRGASVFGPPRSAITGRDPAALRVAALG
jgi:hypothetical protein